MPPIQSGLFGSTKKKVNHDILNLSGPGLFHDKQKFVMKFTHVTKLLIIPLFGAVDSTTVEMSITK
jgi:hypothetical protein